MQDSLAGLCLAVLCAGGAATVAAEPDPPPTATDIHASSAVGTLSIRGNGLEHASVIVDGKLLCMGACSGRVAEGVRTVVIRRNHYKPYTVLLDVQAETDVVIWPTLVKKPSRTDAVVAYVASAVFAGSATAAFVYQGGLASTDSLFADRKYIRYGAYTGWGLAGVIGLSALYYTVRDKGPPSTGTTSLALAPSVGRDFSGLGLAGRF